MKSLEVKQVFKPVPDMDLIFAGDWGDIYSMRGRNDLYKIPTKLKSHNSNGYRKISIKDKNYFVHRLVMAAHVGVCDAPVNHIDGKKDNNYIKNLEYCTTEYNMWHYHNILKTKDEINVPPHLIEKIECYILGTNLSLDEIALELGVYIEDVKKVSEKLDK